MTENQLLTLRSWTTHHTLISKSLSSSCRLLRNTNFVTKWDNSDFWHTKNYKFSIYLCCGKRTQTFAEHFEVFCCVLKSAQVRSYSQQNRSWCSIERPNFESAWWPNHGQYCHSWSKKEFQVVTSPVKPDHCQPSFLILFVARSWHLWSHAIAERGSWNLLTPFTSWTRRFVHCISMV